MNEQETELFYMLKAHGYIDDENVSAYVRPVGGGTTQMLCVCGEIVSLIDVDGESDDFKIFSDSIDRLRNISVKSGLFKKTVAFERDGKRYEFGVTGGKKLLDYFKLLADS